MSQGGMSGENCPGGIVGGGGGGDVRGGGEMSGREIACYLCSFTV